MQTLCTYHQEEIELYCSFPRCQNPYLCLLCFQHHSKTCAANYKTDIKRVRDLVPGPATNFPHAERSNIISDIQTLCQQRQGIYDENQRTFNEHFSQILNFMENTYQQWSCYLTRTADSMVNAEDNAVFTKLSSCLENLQVLNVRKENNYSASFRNWDSSLINEGTELLKQGRISIEKWRLDQTKLENFRSKIVSLMQTVQLNEFFVCYSQTQQQQTSNPNKINNLEASFLQATNQTLQQEVQGFLQTKSQLQSQIDALTIENKTLKAQNALLLEANSAAQAQIQASNKARLNLEEITNQIDKLNSQAFALKSYIAQYPLVEQRLPIVNLSSYQQSPPPALETCPIERAPKIPPSTQNSPIILDTRTRIIGFEALENLAAWIPRPSGARQTDKCKLNLLYQASRDGFNAQDFHSRCDDSGTTIAFIKTKQNKRVFGGYTTKSWRAHGDCHWVEDKEAFMFSLDHQEKYPCKKPGNAIFTCSENLISFGKGLDIGIRSKANLSASNAWTNFPCSYKSEKFTDRTQSKEADSYLAGTPNFLVEEIEVYQVLWENTQNY